MEAPRPGEQTTQDLLELAALVATMSDPVLGKTLDGTICSWNAGAERLYGYSADEIVGKKIDTLVPPERVAEIEEILERLRQGKTITQYETVRRRKDGSDVDVSLSITPVRNSSGDIIGASAVQHDISERKRREEIQSFLAEASRVLSASLDHRKTLPDLAHLTLRIADGCVVELTDASGALTQVAIAHRVPEKEELMREMRHLYPPDANSRALPSRVLRTGKAELIPEVSDKFLENIAQNADHLRILREFRTGSTIIVPLRVRQRAIGTIMLLNGASSRRFAPDDLELTEDLARRAALAIENATLYEAERKARAIAEQAIESTTRLQSLAAELAEALTPQQVAEVVVTQGIASVGADAGALQLLTDDGKTLEVVRGDGSDRTLVKGRWGRFSTDLKLPSNDAIHRLEPVFIESEKDIRENYPDVDDYPHALEARSGLHARAGAHIPLVVSGRPLGVLFLGFTQPRRLSEAQRLFVLALARQCAQALKRAQLYESELEGRSRLSRLVERLHEGVVSIDRRGRVEFASSKAKQMLGAAPLKEGSHVPESWLGFPLRSFVANLFEADVHNGEAQVASQDGERVFDLTGIPAAQSESALLVVSDVSEREQRQRAEREFVNNAAHELRTPLAAITSAIERLQAGARDVPEKRDRFLGHIQRESTRLNRLASSLLVLARAQSREQMPRRTEIPLRELLLELVGGVELKQGVELVVDCPPDLIASSNRDLLEHALLNLATNAARHTDSGRVCISACAEDSGSVRIEVSDTGSGIGPEELGRLFDRFYRGPGEEGRAGFGLGLPITKEAVEALGGHVEIDSVPGEGTTARILLPAAPDRAMS